MEIQRVKSFPSSGQSERRPAAWVLDGPTLEDVMPNQNAHPDAIKLLTTDHRTVEGLFEDFEKARGASRKEKLVRQLCTELKIHSTIEEEIFYPALRGKIEEDMLDEAYVEHDGAKVLINDLETAEPNEEYYDAKVKVLQEQIEHHVGEEEKQRDSMFAQAKKAEVDLNELGRRMAERKAELMEQARTSGLPPAVPQAVGV
jgi:hemerythrin superfamily protein